MRRILCFVAAIAMLLSLLCAGSNAAYGEIITGTAGDDITWTLDTASGVLEFTGTGDMYNYSENYDFDVITSTAPWCSEANYITQVVIANGITSIGNYAFSHCCNFKTIDIPESVTKIGVNAFYSCGLKSAIIRGYADVGNCCFSTCTLETITFVAGAKTVGNEAFYDCAKLVSADLGDVVDIGYHAFGGCTSLSDVNFGSCLKTIGAMAFSSRDNGRLTEVTFPATLESIGYSCFFHSGLTNINFKGTKAQWDAVTVGSDNAEVKAATKVYNYCKHDYGAWVILRAATCTTEGIRRRACTICGKKETVYYSAGHSFEVVVLTEATCTQPGTSVNRCTVCGYEESFTTYADHDFGEVEIVREPTCQTGLGVKTCSVCGQTENVVIPATGVHKFGDWIPETDGNCLHINYDHRYCSICGASESRPNGVGPHNWTDVDWRYFEDGATCTKPGKIHYQCLWCGDEYAVDSPALGHDWDDYYTVTEATDTSRGLKERECWRCGETETEVIPAKLLDFYVDGATLIVNDCEGLNQIRYAKGVYTTSKEIRAAEGMKNISEASIDRIIGEKGRFEYEFLIDEPVSIWLRFDDGRTVVLSGLDFSAGVPHPVVTVNGLRATVSGLEGATVIRVAPGEWATSKEVKRADGNRNFTAKSYIKGASEYTIQFRENGVYTFAVQYENGYIKIITVDIAKKEPSVTQNGNTVTFGNLDDLYIIRYAPGEYTTSKEIKYAPGAHYIRPKAMDENGNITVTLEPGTYTFCVQYNDESFSFYTITVN